ncbi:MAG TPA: class I SAM-dependent methyltransferase [Aggregatilineales bacterium]|nr:class I SAM-dependent methyltransferase [Aggregatilineales bacterium]
MPNSPTTDRRILTEQAYATDEALNVRLRTHDLYSYPKLNFTEWVLDKITWHGDEHVLDVGTGPGTYIDAIQARVPNGEFVVGDLSLGMARVAASRVGPKLVLNLDAESLPFADRTFDVVLANHMLHHVPNLDAALSEFRRVLKPDGCVVAATNSQFNLPEFEQLIQRAYGLLGANNAEIEPLRPADHQFYLEDGAVRLARHFFAVSRHDLPGAFIFPDAQPILDYIGSMRAIREPQLPRRVAWDDFMSVMGEQIDRLIGHFGELVVNKLSGVLIGTNSGYFARDYVALLNQNQNPKQ